MRYFPYALVLFCVNASAQNLRTFYTDTSESCYSTVFSIAEQMPTYNGGMEQLQKDLNNPYTFSKPFSGLFYVNVHINCEGKAYAFQVLKGGDESQNKQLQKVLQALQNWNSGIQKGKPVDCLQLISISIGKRKILVGNGK